MKMYEKKMKRRLLYVVLSGTLAAGALGGCANPQKSGTEALEAENYEEAEAQFQAAADSQDRDEAAAGYRGLGMTYYETGDYTSALDAFQQAVDNGAEQTARLYNLMGICAMQCGDYAAALEYIQAGLALADSSGSGDSEEADVGMIQEMRYNEVVCYEQQADWENAKQKASEYLADYPDDAQMQREAGFLSTR